MRKSNRPATQAASVTGAPFRPDLAAIRRQIERGEYPIVVTERMIDAILDDVLRAEMARGGEDIPPVVTGQGCFERSWPRPGVSNKFFRGFIIALAIEATFAVGLAWLLGLI